MLSHVASWPVALVGAAVIACAAWRAGSLRGDGALAAWLVGALAMRVSWAWGAYLVGWFALASALSRVGRARKHRRTRDVVGKGDRRDAWQVFANGGVFAALAAARLLTGANDDATRVATLLAVAAAAALAASGSDTWSTEIGTMLGGEPWSVRNRDRVPAGTSGAITLSGSAAGLVGAMALAALAIGVGVIPASAFVAVAVGGVLGAWCDTLLGAFVQERRLCPQCQTETERITHTCGTAATYLRGMRGLDNDAVNLICSLTGAGVAVAVTLGFA